MGCCDKEKLFNSGILVEHCEGAVLPPKEQWEKKKGGYVVLPFEDINDTPKIDYSKCTGCGICVSRCPGLACFVIDMTYAEDKAVIKLPYELLPLPEKGQTVKCLGRDGSELADGEVLAVAEPSKDKTYVVSVVIPKDKYDEIRAIKVVC